MSNVPHSRLELRISCRHLLNKDILSKSDPQVVVYTASPFRGGTWVEHARTELVKDNLNPNFAKPILIDYLFEEVQPLRFVVIDVDDPSRVVANQDLLGTYECTLADIVSSSGQSVQKPLVHPHHHHHPHAKAGYIKLVAEELTDLKHVIKMTFHGRNLDKKDLFGKSDPYFQISRTQEDGTTVVVYRSKHIMKTLDPTWDPVVLPIAQLCNGDLDRQLAFEVFDWDRNGSHDLIGAFRASPNELLAAQGNEYPLVNPKKQAKKRGYRDSGAFRILQFYLEDVPSFLDYLAGGTSLGLAVAIDFTASNGDPNLPSSLHHLSGNTRNHYQDAIQAVGAILEPYDADRQFPAFGFGAKMRHDGSVSHCFPLNGDAGNPFVFGVQGVLNEYARTMRGIELWGPTNFSPIINQIAAQIRHEESSAPHPGTNYTVLLILTDGAITDMDATTRAIIVASSLPLSIVIVGVGSADFTNMNILDADDVPLRGTDGRTPERDIVQFVAYRDFATNPHLLAREVLAEIPDQMISYMRAHGVRPRMRRAHSYDSITSQSTVASRPGSATGTPGGGSPAVALDASFLSPLLSPNGGGYAPPPGPPPGRHATSMGLRSHEPGQGASVSAGSSNSSLNVVGRSHTVGGVAYGAGSYPQQQQHLQPQQQDPPPQPVAPPYSEGPSRPLSRDEKTGGW
ncbi:Copine-5 [Thoreauomyces humboldtii]|nr:Copine-5 [Thoreauomyces humboldtii]